MKFEIRNCCALHQNKDIAKTLSLLAVSINDDADTSNLKTVTFYKNDDSRKKVVTFFNANKKEQQQKAEVLNDLAKKYQKLAA